MEFLNLLTIEQKFDLLKLIIPILGAIISIFIFYLTKRKEINFKIHEQRKIKYEHYLSLYEKVFSNPDSVKNGELPIGREEWMKIQIGIILYGSDKVIKKIVKMNDIGRSNSNINLNIIVELGELMHLMRKEVGLSNKNVSIRDSLSFFITDIKDKKHDTLFRKWI